jgi:hypothetical protein
MPTLPKRPTDLMLAPVAAAIDINLQAIRDLTADGIAYTIALQLNHQAKGEDAAERAACIRKVALLHVKLYGWKAEVSSDYTRLRLSGGSVVLELGLSRAIHDYIVG